MYTLLQTSEDKDQPNQELVKETEETTPHSTDGSSTSTGDPPSSSSASTPTSDTVQASNPCNSTIFESEPSSTPLQPGELNSAEAANTEMKECGAHLQTGSDSFAAGLSCPDVNERSSENPSQGEPKTQEATSVQSSVADISNSTVSESKNEDKSQEANPLQTSGHSLAADVGSSGVSGSNNEGKSQEAKEDDQIVPS